MEDIRGGCVRVSVCEHSCHRLLVRISWHAEHAMRRGEARQGRAGGSYMTLGWTILSTLSGLVSLVLRDPSVERRPLLLFASLTEGDLGG